MALAHCTSIMHFIVHTWILFLLFEVQLSASFSLQVQKRALFLFISCDNSRTGVNVPFVCRIPLALRDNRAKFMLRTKKRRGYVKL